MSVGFSTPAVSVTDTADDTCTARLAAVRRRALIVLVRRVAAFVQWFEIVVVIVVVLLLGKEPAANAAGLLCGG